MDINEQAILMLVKEKASILEKVENAEKNLHSALLELEIIIRSDLPDGKPREAFDIAYKKVSDALSHLQLAHPKEEYNMLPF